MLIHRSAHVLSLGCVGGLRTSLVTKSAMPSEILGSLWTHLSCLSVTSQCQAPTGPVTTDEFLCEEITISWDATGWVGGAPIEHYIIVLKDRVTKRTGDGS